MNRSSQQGGQKSRLEPHYTFTISMNLVFEHQNEDASPNKGETISGRILDIPDDQQTQVVGIKTGQQVLNRSQQKPRLAQKNIGHVELEIDHSDKPNTLKRHSRNESFPENGPPKSRSDLRPSPIEIIDRYGRGKNTKYQIKWSDGSITKEYVGILKKYAPRLLASYRRLCRAINTRNYRERQRLLR